MYNQPETVLEKYDLTVNSVTKGRGVYVCDTSIGMKILMPFRGCESRAAFLAEILAYLSENGLMVEQYIPTSEGSFLAEDESGEKFLLKDMVAGNECNTKSREDLFGAVELLAHLHLLLAACKVPLPDFMHAKPSDMTGGFEKHYRELIKVKNYIKGRRKKNEFEMNFQAQYPHFLEQAKQSLTLLEQVEFDDRMMLVHGDFNQHNVIRTPQGQVAVNFEGLGQNLAVSDLANFLRKMMEKNDWDFRLGTQLLERYAHVRPLSAQDYRELYILLLFPEKFWKLANHYSNSHKAWLSGRCIEKLDMVVRQEQARGTFLENLFSFAGES